ncbi:Uncharacterized protein TCM_035674 [Theobroma cacao]|uniref:Uncharacterized protein n=1 Tax=Theobroma cacao TaxID=3641 RepID=A0A061FQJ4_THECC|nr:Uncharacterized protein TCM_035674 [Theobroma cacao]
MELHALISTHGELSRSIIKDEEDVALILLEQRNVPAVYVTIKECDTNIMPHEEDVQHGNHLNQNKIYSASHIPQNSISNPQQMQLTYAHEFVQPDRHMTFIEHLAAQFQLAYASNQSLASVQQIQPLGETIEGVTPFSNEIATLEDNITMLEDDTATLKDNIASNQENKDLLPTDEDRFDDNTDDELDEWHHDSLDDDWLYDNDIPNHNNVEGEIEHVRGVDVGDIQCDDPIYNNPIVGVFLFFPICWPITLHVHQ